ncbi:MAG: alpha/beta fold hydrolase [Clostridia bacterium]|nr:alpha/beta fold hydrolase [Clostridia bacterium]
MSSEKEYYIEDDGVRLHLKLELPDGFSEGDACPLCIVVHGLTGNMEQPQIVAASRAMNDCGLATLRVELYGHGLSGGDFEFHDVDKWLHNLNTITDHAKSLDFVSDLCLCGHSQGGLAILLLAGERPEDFRSILPLSPALNIPDGAKHGSPGAMSAVPFDPEDPPAKVFFHDLPIDGNFLRVAAKLEPEAAAHTFPGPVLLVHGTADTTVPMHYSVDIAKEYADATLVLVDGDTHCYDYHLDKVVEAIRDFLS